MKENFGTIDIGSGSAARINILCGNFGTISASEDSDINLTIAGALGDISTTLLGGVQNITVSPNSGCPTPAPSLSPSFAVSVAHETAACMQARCKRGRKCFLRREGGKY